ncbi:MAG: hypothetical protein Q7R92_04630 [bacterium]|nr:hypothetical protein [bacterium]
MPSIEDLMGGEAGEPAASDESAAAKFSGQQKKIKIKIKELERLTKQAADSADAEPDGGWRGDDQFVFRLRKLETENP